MNGVDISFGFGRHLWDVRASVLINPTNVRVRQMLKRSSASHHFLWPKSNRRQTFSANGIVYPITMLSAKSSILLLYLRVFHVDRTIRYCIWGGIIFQAIFYSTAVGLAIGSLCQCVGLAAITSRFCLLYAKEIQTMILTVNIVTDVYVLVLPIHRVLKLQVNNRRKLGLLVVFAGGIL